MRLSRAQQEWYFPCVPMEGSRTPQRNQCGVPPLSDELGKRGAEGWCRGALPAQYSVSGRKGEQSSSESREIISVMVPFRWHHIWHPHGGAFGLTPHKEDEIPVIWRKRRRGNSMAKGISRRGKRFYWEKWSKGNGS